MRRCHSLIAVKLGGCDPFGDVTRIPLLQTTPLNNFLLLLLLLLLLQ